MKVFLIAALLLLGSFTIYTNFIQRTEGFCIEKIISKHPHNPKWASESQLDPEILSQPYSYLGSGKECYAFASEDDKYVIKFFKQKHMNTGYFFDKYDLIPSRTIRMATRKNLRQTTFQSYQIAHHMLPEETGALYLHLTKTSHLNQSLRLTDQYDKPFTLDLDEMEFLIQKKTTPTFEAFLTLIQVDKIDEAKSLIDSILALITSRSEKGLSDLDLNCERNLGVLGNRALEIDIGEFSMLERAPLIEELTSGTLDLKQWLHNQSLELEEYLDKQLENH